MKSRLLALSLFACLAAPAAWAATPIDQTRPLDPRGKLEIENLKGSIQVRVWDKPEVHISGSLGAGVETSRGCTPHMKPRCRLAIKVPFGRWPVQAPFQPEAAAGAALRGASQK